MARKHKKLATVQPPPRSGRIGKYRNVPAYRAVSGFSGRAAQNGRK